MPITDGKLTLFTPRPNATVPEFRRMKAKGDMRDILQDLVDAPYHYVTADSLANRYGRRAAARIYDLRQSGLDIEGAWSGDHKTYWYTLRSVAEARALLKEWRKA